MNRRRVLQGALLLALWLPLAWSRFPGPEDPAALPVQARLQAVLAGRVARLVDLGGPLPAGVRNVLDENAAGLLDEGLEHRPTAEYLVTRRAILAARAGDRAQALALVSALQGAERPPLVQVLESAWRGGPKAADAEATLDAELDGYYRCLALRQVGDRTAADALLGEQTSRARDDLRLLWILLVLAVGNLGLGVLAVLLWPLYGRRLGNPASPDVEVLWDPVGAAACVVGFQWLAPLAGSPLARVLRAFGVPVIGTVVLTQLALYLLALGALQRLLPRLASAAAPLSARDALGLRGLGLRQVAAGVVGFWLAIPAVLAASWLTSAVLGRSPFSSNQALELLLRATPVELAAMGLLVAVAGPFFEEVLFRGVLFAGLRRIAGPIGAGAASALCFALMHGDPQALLVLATLGGLFAFLYQRTGSLWPAVIAHGLWNGTTAAVVALILGGR